MLSASLKVGNITVSTGSDAIISNYLCRESTGKSDSTNTWTRGPIRLCLYNHSSYEASISFTITSTNVLQPARNLGKVTVMNEQSFIFLEKRDYGCTNHATRAIQ